VKTRLFLFFAFVFYAVAAGAEYRVFLLKISKTPKAPQAPAEFRVVESTLDPDQYRGYFPVAADETVTYTDTWRCFGRTDHRPLCPNPRQPASTQGPDSSSATP
jgi:hypothetical protein